ncbi:putative CRISPR-associated nuclease/helicase Cas3 [[Clostridium] ultunense Esp]|nr:putative CRISPR-associated nuclease/helicase Cas3 [[Clostridium] ultunense Esp]
MNRLLAKKMKLGTEFGALLPGHLTQVRDVAKIFVNTPDLLNHTGLGADELSYFRKSIQLVSILHDLGKANPYFQGMLSQEGRRITQPIRHEVVSDWILRKHEGIYRAVLKWIDLPNHENSIHDWKFVSLRVAILGHHLKFPGSDHGQGEEITIQTDHNDFKNSLRLLEELTGEEIKNFSVPPLIADYRWLDKNVKKDFRHSLVQSGLGEELSNEKGKYASLLRTFLLSMDSLGSVASETEEDWQHYRSVIQESIQGSDLTKTLKKMIDLRLEGRTPDPEINDFQIRVGKSEASVTIVEAGCGSGKTISSYLWAEKRNAKNFFLAYPTTATATQGYLDYGLLAPEASKLLHSRSTVDMELLANGEEENDEDTAAAMNAMDRIQKPFVLCTVDTILGVVQNYRSSAILFPKLLNGVAVFDEVHSYDDSLFQHLLEFLGTVSIPTLLMSASLQAHRKKEILNLLEKRGRSVQWIKGPEAYERRIRYRIRMREQLDEEVIWSALREGRKVLVIANQVKAARGYYETLKEKAEKMGIEAKWFLYHARFEYQDRVERQQEIVSHFREGGAVCAVTTQIAEMSFDISADLLISEISDFPSIIQRLGRLNRYAKEGDPVKEAYFFKPKEVYPYTSEEITQAEEVLLELKDQDISQMDLAVQLNHLEGRKLQSSIVFAWQSLLSAKADQSLREPGYSIDCLRELHYEPRQRQPWSTLQKYLIPMPGNGISPGLRKVRSAYLIPEEKIDYTKEKGGRWKDE